jgi:uncharacterized protein (TIGR00255 family)
MIMSMTGFGSHEIATELFKIKFEIKTVNQRYTDINVKGPRKFIKYEDILRNRLKERISRGKIDLFISIENNLRDDLEVVPDLSLIRKYYNAYSMILEEFDLQENIDLKTLIRVPDALLIRDKDLSDEQTLNILNEVLDGAVDNLKSMRIIEGEKIKIDILMRLEDIESCASNLEKISPEIVKSHKEKMIDKIKDLMEDFENYSQERLDMEVAVFADKKDITEEITRLNSHISQVRGLMDSNEPVGRKLDFIIQEMNREVNTMGSKSSSLEITNTVIHMKSELEKIREQVQNIE